MKKISNYILLLLPLALGLVASLMIFLPTLIYSDTDSVFTGVETVFGTEFANLGIFGSGQIEPSFLGMFAFGLPLVAGLLALLVPKKPLFYGIIFAAGAVLLVLLPTYAVASVTILGDRSVLDITWTMGAGLIIAIIAAASGVVTSIVLMLKK